MNGDYVAIKSVHNGECINRDHNKNMEISDCNNSNRQKITSTEP